MSEQRDQRGLGTHQRADRPKPGDEVDRASADSFPASDPPSYSGVTGAGKPDKEPSRPASDDRPAEARPAGTPTSNRHATETSHQWEDQEGPHRPAQGRDV